VWSGKSGLFTDLAIYIHTRVPGTDCECSHPGYLIWAVEFEIGGRYFGRQNVHLWSARFIEKVRKRWTEKTKVRTWSGKSGLFTDLAIYIHTQGLHLTQCMKCMLCCSRDRLVDAHGWGHLCECSHIAKYPPPDLEFRNPN